jgi:5-methylcytosine-specific restriction endonuclease McrA
MTAFTPGPTDQLAFLNNVQRLLNEGDFVATYKFALLATLADLSIEHDIAPDGTLTLPIRDIAEKFIAYYWPQTSPFRPATPGASPAVLQQNAGGQAKVIRLIDHFQSRYTPRLGRAPKDARRWDKLVAAVSKVVIGMPLWRLQTVGAGEAANVFLYENTGGNVQSIALFPGVAWSFRQFHGLITRLVQSAWVMQIHRIKRNERLLGSGADLHEFLFGSDRANLDSYRPLLTDLQAKTCFYCRRPLRGRGEVDHFIPWSRYPIDLGHNFVLAHKACNGSKGDLLADAPHLAHWLERNTHHATTLAREFDAIAVRHDLDTSLRIAQWAYEQTASTGGYVWRQKNSIRPLSPSWQALFV